MATAQTIVEAKFHPPVDALLTLGEPECEPSRSDGQWRDYAELGIGAEHAGDLIRMASDRGLHIATGTHAWACLHAWRALSQLRPPEAAEPLVDVLGHMAKAEDDWGLEDLPVVLARIGEPALRPLKRLLGDARNHTWARVGACSALEKMGLEHPALRGPTVAALMEQLKWAQFNGPHVNAFIITALIELDAAEARDLIVRAYAVGEIDETVNGPLEVVLADLAMTREDREMARSEAAERARKEMANERGADLVDGELPTLTRIDDADDPQGEGVWRLR